MSTVRATLPKEPDSRPHKPAPSSLMMCGDTHIPRPKKVEEMTPEEKADRGGTIIECAIRDVCTAAAGGRVLRSAINNLSFLGFKLSATQEARLAEIMQRAVNAGSLEKKHLSRDARTIADDIIRGDRDKRTQPASA